MQRWRRFVFVLTDKKLQLWRCGRKKSFRGEFCSKVSMNVHRGTGLKPLNVTFTTSLPPHVHLIPHCLLVYSVWRLSEVKASVFHLIVDIPEFVCCALRILLIPPKILHDQHPKVQKLRQKQIWDQKSVAFSMNPALSHTHVYKLTVRLAEWLNICNNPIKGNCIPVKVTEKEM